jgi:predicted TIM-barrel fold metal-dependent hydrolase
MMLECDCPHSDSRWPGTIELASKWLSRLPHDTQDRLTVGNATPIYNFTPADPATSRA